MSQFAARLLNLVPRGQHAADPMTAPTQRAVTREAVVANLAARRELTAQADIPTEVIPALSVDATWPPRATIAEDYRALPVFQAVVRGACTAGLTGIGTRGPALIPPPEFGLDGFDVAPAGDDGTFFAEFDAGVAEVEAGFYNARRVFHSADTAGFPGGGLMTTPTVTEAEAIGRGWFAYRRVKQAPWPDCNREAIGEAVEGVTLALETYRDLLSGAAHPGAVYPELEREDNAYDRALSMTAQDAGEWAAELDRLVPEEADEGERAA